MELAKLYNVSTDYLLLDEIEELPDDVVVDTYEGTIVKEVTLDEANSYIKLIRESSKKIALGVLLCILSPAPLMVLLGANANQGGQAENIVGGIGVACLLIMIAIAVAIFVFDGMKLDAYEYLEKEEFSLGYGVSGIIKKEEEKFRPGYYRYMALGVALCVISAVPLIVAAGFSEEENIILYMVAVLLLLIALGVFLIVWVSVEKDAYDKLLQVGDYTEEQKYRNKKLEVFSGAYWCIVTAIYLGVSFIYHNWHISWVVWPIAGVLFAAIHSILGAFVKKQ